MSNRELPMMPWFPKEFAAATSTWSFDERGAYRALLDIQWEERLLPDEPERLARAIGMELERFRKLWPKVRRKFVNIGDGIANERLEEHRAKSMNLSEKRAVAGKAGGVASGKQRSKQIRSKASSKPEAKLEANDQAKPKPPSPSPSLREEHPLPPQGGGPGLTANGGGRKPREERDASLGGWREITPLIDDIASTGSLPPDQRRTWADVGKHCDDAIAVKAAEQVGFRLIADRDKFTTTDLQNRFREAYERLAAEAAH